jgi:tetratricopeptide (TPR) repeat protein
MANIAKANALGRCEDIMQPPLAQRVACDAAIEAATDPLERARLLVARAGTHRREQNRSMADAALADLTRAEHLAPDADPALRADRLVERAAIYSLQGNHQAALVDIEEAERLAPADADPVVIRGIDLANQGKGDDALVQLARARELEPDHVDAHYWSMFYEYDSGDLEACVEIGAKAVEIAPEDVRVRAFRGLCLAELGRAEEAMVDIQAAERIGPHSVDTYEVLLYAHYALDHRGEVLATGRRAVEMAPMDELANALLTIGLIETGAVDEAVAAYQEAEAAGVGDTEGFRSNNLAWGLYEAGQHEAALPIIEQGLAGQTEPHPDHIDTAAHVLAALGRTEEAVAEFLRAVEVGGPGQRDWYAEHLTALGHNPGTTDAEFEAALRACVATGDACKLFPQ